VEGVLHKDMATIGEYIQIWKLKLKNTEKVVAVVHLKNN